MDTPQATDSYGFPIVSIEALAQIAPKARATHYRYNGAHFLYKTASFCAEKTQSDPLNALSNKTDRLVVVFHGAAAPTVKRPIFRCYNTPFTVDLLSISDILMDTNKQLTKTWYSSTAKHDYLAIYKEIIAHFVTLYPHIVFFGTSAGGLPALYFASIFHKVCLFSNSQLYPVSYYEVVKEINKILAKEDDQLAHIDIDATMAITVPLHVHMYINKADDHHYTFHATPFLQMCERIGYDLRVTQFVKKSAKPHNEQFTKCYVSCIMDCFRVYG